MDITSIVSPMVINNHELSAKAESCFEFAHEDLKIEHLRPILCELLSCFSACYLTKSWNCWTIVKSDEFYFLFDPVGIKVPGKKMSQHRAVLYRFCSLDLLLELLLECTECLSEENTLDIYKLGGIITTIENTLAKPTVQKSIISKKKKIAKCPKFNVSKTNLNMQLRQFPENHKTCENRTRRC